MKPGILIGFIAATLCHAWVLFGFRPVTPATRLPLSNEPSSVEVNLVAAAFDSAAPAATPSESAPIPEPDSSPDPTPEPAIIPEPAQTPEPTPSPSPTVATPEPVATQAPTPLDTPQPQPISQPKARTGRKHTAKPTVQSTQGNTGAHPGQGIQGDSISFMVGPHYRSNPRPRYPADARSKGQEGLVLLSVEIGTNGQPTDVILKETSGVRSLDQAAIEAVKRWVFEPARAGGTPIATRQDVPVRFRLN